MFTSKVNAASFRGRGKGLALIKRVKLLQKFEEAGDVACLLNVCP